MSSLGNLLELVFARPDPTVSVHAVVREECDRDKAKQVQDRFMKTQGKPSAPAVVWFGMAPVLAAAGVDWALDKVRPPPPRPEPDRESELTIWLTPSGRARVERAWQGPDGHHRLTEMATVNRPLDETLPRFWPVQILQMKRRHLTWPTPSANDVERLFSHALLRQIIAALELDDARDDEVAGRPAVAVRATGRKPDHQLGPHWLPFGADDYELRFDREFAHLLGIRGRVDGEVYEEVAVTEISYGDPLDEALLL